MREMVHQLVCMPVSSLCAGTRGVHTPYTNVPLTSATLPARGAAPASAAAACITIAARTAAIIMIEDCDGLEGRHENCMNTHSPV